ncbi:MAG: zinc ribbon domain-containing protein [Actinobacteria bacterium]|nr:zinc ribbon domain-containing protein [Actinomycetota bacterium]
MTTVAVCGRCGTPRAAGALFCGVCGNRFDGAAAPIAPSVSSPPPPPVAAAPAGPRTAAMTAPVAAAPAPASISGADVADRAKRRWLPLLLVALMGFLDYQTHGSLAFVVPVGLAAVGGVLFGGDLSRRLGLDRVVGRVPSALRPALLAAPALLWFAFRGGGPLMTAILVPALGVGIGALVGTAGPGLDASLAGFYRARDRLLPRKLRMVLGIALPILVTTLLVGGLGGIPAMLGFDTQFSSVDGREVLLVLGTVFSAGMAFFFLREAPE